MAVEKYFGKVAFKGIAIGKIVEIKKQNNEVRRHHIEDVEAEKSRFFSAQQEAISQLAKLYDLAIKEVGEANASIFDVHQMMLEDPDYVDAIVNIIESQEVNADYAVATTGDNFAEIFASMDDDYMKERSADVKDISERVIAVLGNKNTCDGKFSEPCIIVSDDLSPSETVQMDKSKVLAFVTRKGSVNSHTAILSRTMAIPALVDTEVAEGIDGKIAIVNGFDGSFIVEPTQAQIDEAIKLQQEEREMKKLLQEYKTRVCETKSGKKIKLYANIGGISDIGSALQNSASGIGLFRSEFLYLEQKDFPSEELQFAVYKQAVEMMAGKRVIIRTLDIGADKQIDYFKLDKEENPALGYRAVRICLTKQEVFVTQLRALIRASAFGKIAIMIPMISSVWEVQKVKELIESIKLELNNQGIKYGNFEFGIMIETPAAVMIADELAKEVDFFSIGTNDLTQYTLALDRQNPKLDKFYDSHHPAVLKMIKMVISAAHDNQIWAGICGELAADTTLTKTFVEYGIDELSVSPSAILPVKKIICELE